MSAKIRLKIGDVEIEYEGTDDYLRDHIPDLMERVISLRSALRTETPVRPAQDARVGEGAVDRGEEGPIGDHEAGGDETHPLQRLADRLGVNTDELDAAVSPQSEPPYIHLDAHQWSALKRNTPNRGPGSIAPQRSAATVVALWFRYLGRDAPTVEEVRIGLEASGLETSHISRRARTCRWLQERSGRIQLKPTEIEAAEALAKAFVQQRAPNSNS